jgi:lysophospholipase L1-like esterase
MTFANLAWAMGASPRDVERIMSPDSWIMKISAARRGSTANHQRLFDFLARRLARERRFKRVIVVLTLLVVVVLLGVFPRARVKTMSAAVTAAGQAVGSIHTREAIDRSWQTFRQLGIDDTRPRVERLFAEAPPAYQRLLRYAGMDPEHGLIRWANFDWTILLPSTVFEIDDYGRSYRLRPRTRSVWLRNADVPAQAGSPVLFYIVPDGPGLADAIRGTTATVVQGSRQTTNSWGFRGPEPDSGAPVRVMVLGDSFMQGMFIGDDDTPPEYLRRHLEQRLATRVSVLNTGIMGYSPEQYCYTMAEFIDRFRPQLVVVSVYINDFGNALKVIAEGEADWQEARYWLGKIADVCQTHRCGVLVVPAPVRPCLIDRRTSGNYPGRFFNALDLPALRLFDPFDDFVAAYLKILADRRRRAEPDSTICPLYNDVIQDEHLSAEGARVWARSVGERVILLLDYDRAEHDAPPPAVKQAVRASDRAEIRNSATD